MIRSPVGCLISNSGSWTPYGNALDVLVVAVRYLFFAGKE